MGKHSVFGFATIVRAIITVRKTKVPFHKTPAAEWLTRAILLNIPFLGVFTNKCGQYQQPQSAIQFRLLETFLTNSHTRQYHRPPLIISGLADIAGLPFEESAIVVSDGVVAQEYSVSGFTP